MTLLLIGVPILFGGIAFGVRSDSVRGGIWISGAVFHLLGTLRCWKVTPSPIGGWLLLDSLGLIFLSCTSLVFLVTTVYAMGYLKNQTKTLPSEVADRTLWVVNAPEAVFVGCMLLFLGAMTLVVFCHHFGLLWVAIEMTTLVSAPLIYFHRNARSLEATWKYLMICSVGIALALLGNFFLAVAFPSSHGGHHSMLLGDLLKAAGQSNQVWIRVAWIFLLVGYGTKMGLAPMHTWLPDTYSESPSPVSALLSGVAIHGAFIGIFRVLQIVCASGQGDFARELLLFMGLLSMGVSVIFIFQQASYKRLLAYSSVEHMGILAVSLGLGGMGTWGGLFHAVNHSLLKAMMFILAGNILTCFRTRWSREVSGLRTAIPITGFLWLIGFLALTGSPPFGMFFSEWTILNVAIQQSRYGVVILFLFFLVLIFIGMSVSVLKMVQGEVPAGIEKKHESWDEWVPALILGLGVLIFGLYIPSWLLGELDLASKLLN